MPVATQEPSLPSTHNRNTRCSITSNSRTERVQPGCIRVSTKHFRISHILPLAERAYESGGLGDHAPRPGHEISGAMPTCRYECDTNSPVFEREDRGNNGLSPRERRAPDHAVRCWPVESRQPQQVSQKKS